MSNHYCVSCGEPIPDWKRNCSMCYGDIDYGKDGYYRQWAESEDQRRRDEERECERQQEEQK